MPAYRPLPEEYDAEFAAMLSYAFSPESGPYEHDPDEAPPPPARPGAKRALFDDEDLLAVCKHHWFTCQVGEAWLPVGGVSAIATPPENRRQGHVRRLLAGSLAEYRDREVPLAALWAFEHPFYAQFGWAVANRFSKVTVPPEELAFARETPEGEHDRQGRFVRVDSDDYQRLEPVLTAHNEDYALAMDRTEEWWRTRVFSAWDTDPYVYGWERDGELRSYVVYRVEEEENVKRLQVTESAWVDHEARLAVLAFLADHDSQVESVGLYEPEPELLDLVPDPGEVEAEVHAGPMVRVADVTRALEARSYPEEVAGAVVLDVDDPLCPWNDARFELTLDDGAASVEPVSEDASVGDADVSLGIGALSQLYVGYRSIDGLVRTGDTTVLEVPARDVLSTVFPPTSVFLRERF